MHLAAKLGLFNIVKLLASYKCNVNIQNQVGFTPLHVALREGMNKK
jgi:ankyrin repeat protein